MQFSIRLKPLLSAGLVSFISVQMLVPATANAHHGKDFFVGNNGAFAQSRGSICDFPAGLY